MLAADMKLKAKLGGGTEAEDCRQVFEPEVHSLFALLVVNPVQPSIG